MRSQKLRMDAGVSVSYTHLGIGQPGGTLEVGVQRTDGAVTGLSIGGAVRLTQTLTCLLYTSSEPEPAPEPAPQCADDGLDVLWYSAPDGVLKSSPTVAALVCLMMQPVSYTHLDVYKRQPSYPCTITGAPVCTYSSFSAAAVQPVRQVCTLCASHHPALL